LRGTPLYDLAKAHNLVADECSTDFLKGSRSGQFSSNLLPHEGAATAEELKEVGEEMQQLLMETETGKHFGKPSS
jgi:hypothetical protein